MHLMHTRQANTDSRYRDIRRDSRRGATNDKELVDRVFKDGHTAMGVRDRYLGEGMAHEPH